MSGAKDDKSDNTEGRLKRWSKRKRGKDQNREDQPSPQPKKRGGAAPVAVAEPDGETVSAPASDSGGLTERGFVKPLPPLAGPEEGDAPYEAAQADALALLDPENAELAARKAFPIRPEDEGYSEDGTDIELTPEQEEAVKDLPPIESLQKDSDFTPFFASNVPDFLKRQAFKALWMSNPFFGFRDGLDDYDENYRLIDKLITAADSDYKPGKGYGLEDDDAEDDVGDGDDEFDGDGGGESEQEDSSELAEADEDETPKEPRKSDVRPPDNAV